MRYELKIDLGGRETGGRDTTSLECLGDVFSLSLVMHDAIAAGRRRLRGYDEFFSSFVDGLWLSFEHWVYTEDGEVCTMKVYRKHRFSITLVCVV